MWVEFWTVHYQLNWINSSLGSTQTHQKTGSWQWRIVRGKTVKVKDASREKGVTRGEERESDAEHHQWEHFNFKLKKGAHVGLFLCLFIFQSQSQIKAKTFTQSRIKAKRGSEPAIRYRHPLWFKAFLTVFIFSDIFSLSEQRWPISWPMTRSPSSRKLSASSIRTAMVSLFSFNFFTYLFLRSNSVSVVILPFSCRFCCFLAWSVAVLRFIFFDWSFGSFSVSVFFLIFYFLEDLFWNVLGFDRDLCLFRFWIISKVMIRAGLTELFVCLLMRGKWLDFNWRNKFGWNHVG